MNRDHLGILSGPAVVCAMIDRACAAVSFSFPIGHILIETIYHQSLYVGSVHPPQTQGNVQSAVRLALSGRYLLQTEALMGLIDLQTTSKVPEELSLPIMAGFDR